MAFVLTVITVSFKVEARDLELITDDADTITLTELDEVKAALEDVSTRHSVDVALYTLLHIHIPPYNIGHEYCG